MRECGAARNGKRQDMDYTRLKNNIVDVIKEEQVKLGYRSETIRLYYPLKSLNRFLGQKLDTEAMLAALSSFCDGVKEELGAIEISNAGERFCIKIPPEGVDFIHENIDDSEFICEFIRLIEKHGCTMDELIALFRRFSDKVHVEKAEHGEFNYLIYFEDGKPDNYRYCLTDEGCHIIYHRFTPEDYLDFEF